MKPCNNCPFMKSSPLDGAPDWLREVLELHAADEYFTHTCHKTDPNADGYSGKSKVRECAGHLTIMMNGFDNNPGKDGVYDSIEQMARSYLDKWGVKLPKGARLIHLNRGDV